MKLQRQREAYIVMENHSNFNCRNRSSKQEDTNQENIHLKKLNLPIFSKISDRSAYSCNNKDLKSSDLSAITSPNKSMRSKNCNSLHKENVYPKK